MSEIDISAKIKRLIAFGIPGLVVLAVAVASLIWYMQYGSGDITVADARVSSNVIAAKARVSGTVSEVLVQEGDQVKAGDVIARLKVDVTDEQLKQLQQTVELSQRNLEQLKKGVTVQTPRVVSQPAAGVSSVEIERARSRMERMNQLFEMGAISAVKRDEAAAEYQALAASAAPVQSSVTYDTTVQAASPETIKKAEIQVKQAQAALEKAKGNAADTEITAPVDGVVYLGDTAVGSQVQAGQVIASVGNSQEMWIEAYPDEEQMADIRLGQSADFYVDRVKYQGLVLEITRPEMQASQANTEGTPAAADGANAGDGTENGAAATQQGTEGTAESQPARTVVKVSISPEDALNIKLGQAAEVRFLKKG